KNNVVTDFIEQKEKEMNGFGRILVRTSGTEPIIRVMTEGKDKEQVERVAREIAEVLKNELN
nr:phosphoglucosamine mutase [Fusobacteriaceae bacterium]